ncbi:DMT family transporter [Loktanella sp. IMCC34160]|uniref:DMT family transporter n=1 Tax=Loktanella sp. IMCC34160 TaxID=2510646 RepID=UPI00101B8211|nr:DMT family transporter [Loktanella sp. IMCC34160]RYG89353.1 DMT family transporter [Loktanella sp. IMCC34160]
MTAWIPITLLAATAQTIRFMLQKHLKSTRLSTVGATFARFFYSFPMVAVLALSYAAASGQALPELPSGFFGPALIGGAAQIVGTLCVVALFSLRNFAVGTTFMKTEVILSIPVGMFWLGDRVGPLAFVAILVGLCGVLLMSDTPRADGRGGWRRVVNPAAGIGLLSGLAFAVSAVGYRGATLSLAEGDAVLRALVTLSFVTASQALALALWLGWRDRAEIGRVVAAWRVAGFVGVFSMIGSACWFTAFALQQVAYVKAVGQVEVALSALASLFVFREAITGREWAGLILLGGSVIGLVLVA